VYSYDRGREDQRKGIGIRLIIAAILVGLAELVTTEYIGGAVLAGWGLVVAGVGAAGLFASGIWVLRCDSLTG
jgi:hypothetical protein